MNKTFCVADRGELHRVAVVGQNATLLHEIPLFSSQEPVNNIILYKVNETHNTTLTQTSIYSIYICLQRPEASVLLHSDSVMVPFVSRIGLWWAALCLLLVFRLQAAVFIPAVRCVLEPEDWDACGKKMPASLKRQSEYELSINREIQNT